MQNAHVSWICPVSGHMDVTRRRFDLARTFDDGPVAINQQQIVWLHLRPVQTVRVDQVALRFAGRRSPQGNREVIANTFIEIETSGQP